MNITTIKQTLLKFRLLYNLLDKMIYIKWIISGKPMPPHHFIKQRVIRGYAEKYNTPVFIETGTYMGEMVYAVRKIFKEIYSIELNKPLAQKAQKQFSKYKHISIIQGESSQILPDILSSIKEPCLFWLDAHYSGGITSQIACDIETPIFKELEYILNSNAKCNAILIDDAREFVGERGYPTIDECQKFVLSKRPNWKFEVQDDIIRIYE
ncbi:hypothetical protein [Lutibacter sp.]